MKIGILGPCSGRGPRQFGVRKPSDEPIPGQETRIEDIAEPVIDLAPLRPDRLPRVGKVERSRTEGSQSMGIDSARQRCVSDGSLPVLGAVSSKKEPLDGPSDRVTFGE